MMVLLYRVFKSLFCIPENRTHRIIFKCIYLFYDHQKTNGLDLCRSLQTIVHNIYSYLCAVNAVDTYNVHYY